MSGGVSARNVYYLVRRHLGYSRAEWDALAWWEQEMYLDGLVTEELVQFTPGSTDSTVVSEKVRHESGMTIVDRKHHADFNGTPGEMAAFGFRERTL